MDFTYTASGLTVRFVGDIDECASKNLRAQIDRLIDVPRLKSVVFDFSNVSFVDSTGLGLIFGRYKKLAARGVELLLKDVPAHVDKIFRASGVYSVCPKI